MPIRRRQRLSLEAYIQGIKQRDRVVLSKAITLIESGLESDREQANQLVEACLPLSGKSYRLGISGAPGVGKSTFIDAFGCMLAEQGKKLAVLAIDPSSQRTKGSILGDKTRMNRLSVHPNAFIRPSPASGSLGGVARQTRETLLLCEAAGYDHIIVETVGVGQSEVAVHGMVDFFLLLVLPNAGDDLQGIKKGIMEMADTIVINKADGAFLPKARITKANYSQALRLFSKPESGWRPTVLLASALEKTGLEKIQQLLEDYRSKSQESQYWQTRRTEQALQWMYDAIRYGLEDRFFHHPEVQQELDRLSKEVINRSRAPIQVAEELLKKYANPRSNR